MGLILYEAWQFIALAAAVVSGLGIARLLNDKEMAGQSDVVTFAVGILLSTISAFTSPNLDVVSNGQVITYTQMWWMIFIFYPLVILDGALMFVAVAYMFKRVAPSLVY
jgi:hypothetical protein